MSKLIMIVKSCAPALCMVMLQVFCISIRETAHKIVGTSTLSPKKPGTGSQWLAVIVISGLCGSVVGCRFVPTTPYITQGQNRTVAKSNFLVMQEEQSMALTLGAAGISLEAEAQPDEMTAVIFQAHDVAMPILLTRQTDRSRVDFIDLDVHAHFLLNSETGFVRTVGIDSNIPFFPLKDQHTVIGDIALPRPPKYGLHIVLAIECARAENTTSYEFIVRMRFLRHLSDFDTPYHSALRRADQQDLWDRSVSIGGDFELQSSVQFQSLPYISSSWISCKYPISNLGDFLHDSAWVFQLNDEVLNTESLEFVLFDGVVVPIDSD